MAEIKINFDLTFSRRFIQIVGTAAMVLCAVPDLNSESVTLSTYYPAPSGVYTNMITTGNTYLARDGGSVGIFTTAPAALLDVNGTVRVVGAANLNSTLTVTGTSKLGQMTTTAANALSTADPHAADVLLGSDWGVRHDSSIMMWSVASAMRLQSSADVLYINTWNQPLGTYNVALAAGTGAKSTFKGPVEATVHMATQGPLCGAPLEYTYPTPGGGTISLCPGQYVTTTTGWYTKYVVLPVDRGPNLTPPVNPTANYVCCPCPAGGCTL